MNGKAYNGRPVIYVAPDNGNKHNGIISTYSISGVWIHFENGERRFFTWRDMENVR